MKHRRISVIVALALVAIGFGVLPASPALAATKTWDAGAGTNNWSDAGNWNDDAVPVAADAVILDNSLIAGSYTVNLPSGAAIVAISKLTISPTSGNTITLVLPSGNTANPGLNVGDATAATDDIVLDSGAVLVNSSGGPSGSGIAVNSTSNGTLRINNGGRYVHSTVRANSGLVSRLSTAAGTELGIFEFDVPGNAVSTPSFSDRTYGSLTLTKTSGTGAYSVSGGSAVTIRGHFALNPGSTFISTMTAAMNLGGNLVNNGAALTFPSGQAVNLNGTSAQSISGSGPVSFSSLTLNNVAGATCSRDVTVDTALALTIGDITAGANTLTLTEPATTAGAGEVWGNVKRTGTLVAAKTYSFGNPNVSLNFASATTMPTDVTINLAAGTPSGFANAASRNYAITPSGGSDYSATVRLHYLDTELGSNVESQLRLWRYDGATWVDQGGAVDTTNNYAEVSGVTAFSPWAVSSGQPTAITLRTFSAAPQGVAAALPLAGLVLLGGLACLHRRHPSPGSG
jgi:hypothetical protein